MKREKEGVPVREKNASKCSCYGKLEIKMNSVKIMVSKPLLIISKNLQKTGKLSEVKCFRSHLLETHQESEICMHVYFFPFFSFLL